MSPNPSMGAACVPAEQALFDKINDHLSVAVDRALDTLETLTSIRDRTFGGYPPDAKAPDAIFPPDFEGGFDYQSGKLDDLLFRTRELARELSRRL